MSEGHRQGQGSKFCLECITFEAVKEYLLLSVYILVTKIKFVTHIIYASILKVIDQGS